jgi:hypothetical protein
MGTRPSRSVEVFFRGESTNNSKNLGTLTGEEKEVKPTAPDRKLLHLSPLNPKEGVST